MRENSSSYTFCYNISLRKKMNPLLRVIYIWVHP